MTAPSLRYENARIQIQNLVESLCLTFEVPLPAVQGNGENNIYHRIHRVMEQTYPPKSWKAVVVYEFVVYLDQRRYGPDRPRTIPRHEELLADMLIVVDEVYGNRLTCPWEDMPLAIQQMVLPYMITALSQKLALSNERKG